MSPADVAAVSILLACAFATGAVVGHLLSGDAFAYRTKRRELEHTERMAVLAQHADRERALLAIDTREVSR